MAPGAWLAIATHDAKFAYWSIRPTQADPTMTRRLIEAFAHLLQQLAKTP